MATFLILILILFNFIQVNDSNTDVSTKTTVHESIFLNPSHWSSFLTAYSSGRGLPVMVPESRAHPLGERLAGSQLSTVPWVTQSSSNH